VNTLAVTIGRVTLLVFGLRYDIATVGLLRAANRVTDSVQGPTVTPLMGLWFPLMLKVKGDIEGEREVYRSIVRTAALITLPAFAGLAVVAPDLVALALPREYAGVTPILQALSITLLQIPLLWFNNGALAALNMNKVALAYTLGLVISSIGTLMLLTNGLSPPHAILVQSIPAAVMGVVGNVIVNRRLQQTNLEHYRGLLPAVLATTAMAAMTWLVALQFSGAPPLLRLIICVIMGGGVYLAWLLTFHRSWFKECVSLLISRRKTQTGIPEATESTAAASA
jgi:O-antigen/teichoic acid export membrane protein